MTTVNDDCEMCVAHFEQLDTVLVCAYVAPNRTEKQAASFIRQNIEHTIQGHNNMMLVGNFDQDVRASAEFLADLSTGFNLPIKSSFDTTTSRDSCIDMVFANLPHLVRKVGLTSACCSDHKAVLISMTC